jgi:hypothetical protein
VLVVLNLRILLRLLECDALFSLADAYQNFGGVCFSILTFIPEDGGNRFVRNAAENHITLRHIQGHSSLCTNCHENIMSPRIGWLMVVYMVVSLCSHSLGYRSLEMTVGTVFVLTQ